MKNVIDEYRKSERSAALAELLKNPVLADAMRLADSVAPVNAGARIAELPHAAYIQHGIDRGYAMYPNTLRMLASVWEADVQIEPTYAPPEKEKEPS